MLKKLIPLCFIFSSVLCMEKKDRKEVKEEWKEMKTEISHIEAKRNLELLREAAQIARQFRAPTRSFNPFDGLSERECETQREALINTLTHLASIKRSLPQDDMLPHQTMSRHVRHLQDIQVYLNRNISFLRHAGRSLPTRPRSQSFRQRFAEAGFPIE